MLNAAGLSASAPRAMTEPAGAPDGGECCAFCGHSPVLVARVAADKFSKALGEYTAREGDIWTLCLYCDLAGIAHSTPDDLADYPDDDPTP